MFYKKKTYYMDIKSADAALQNIFAACDRTPNSVPFDKLVLRQQARTQVYDILLCIIALLMAFTLLAPFAFIQSRGALNSASIDFTQQYILNDHLNLSPASDILKENM